MPLGTPGLATVPPIANPDYMPFDRQSGDALRRTLWRLYNTSKAMRQPHESIWRECWRAWEGSLALSDTSEVPEFYVNEIWKYVEHTVARMTELPPNWDARPGEGSDEDLVAVMEQFLEWSMRKAKTAGPLQMGNRMAEVAGTTIWKVPWNPDLQRGKGRNELWCCDLNRIYPDLNKTELDQMSFIIQELFLDIGYVKRRWGVSATAVPELSDFEENDGAVVSASRSTALGTAFMPPVLGTQTGNVSTGRTKVLECWIRDYVLESTGIALPESQREKAKNPDWYLVYTTEEQLLPGVAGSGPGVTRIPYMAPPFVVYRPVPHHSQFYGVTPLHPLLDPQREYNEGREQLRQHRRRHTQPRFTVDPRYPLDPADLANRDQPLYVPPGAAQYLNPPALGREVIQSVEMAAADMEEISGIHDVARGERVPQLTSGDAIHQMQQKSDIRVNARIPLLAEALVEIGEHMLYNGALHWGIAGMLRIAGTLDVDVSKIDMKGLTESAADVLDFDVRVQVGSGTAQRTVDQTNAVLLAQAGMIDPEAVLEILDVRKRHKIIERMQQKAAQQAQAEAATAAAGSAPGPYSDEAIVGAQSPAQLPPALQEAIAIAERVAGPGMGDFAFRQMQEERAEALARGKAKQGA